LGLLGLLGLLGGILDLPSRFPVGSLGSSVRNETLRVFTEDEFRKIIAGMR